MELILALAMGISLSACCGFRLLIPPTVLSILAYFSGINLGGTEFEFLSSPVTVIVLIIASCCEIAAYYIPWLDNLLDVISAPISAIAGTAVSGVALLGMSPLGIEFNEIFLWVLAAIAGGGSAFVTHSGASVVRASSTAITGGLGNALWATLELFLAVVGSLLACFVPLLMFVLVLVLLIFLIKKVMTFRNQKKMASTKPLPKT